MHWNLDKNRPICPQIYERFCVEIGCGLIKPEEKLPSVREVAMAAGVNPNTVQKAFGQLEATGLIYSVRSLGWFVGENTKLAEEIVQKLAAEKTEYYFKEMESLGFSAEETKKYIKELSQ